MTDDFSDLAGRGPVEPTDLVEQVRRALGEDPGRLEVEAEGDELAWLVRDGVRVSSFSPRAVAGADPARREAFASALAELVRGFDALRPTIEGLEVGRAYAVDYRHDKLRRIFRVKGTLLEVSPWRPAEGPSGGGWTLTFASRPRFGSPSTFRVETEVLTRIVPA